MTIYGVVGSQPARAVMWTLEIKQQPYNLVRTIPPKQTRTAEFFAMNPAGTIPVLKDGDCIIWEVKKPNQGSHFGWHAGQCWNPEQLRKCDFCISCSLCSMPRTILCDTTLFIELI